MIGPATSLAQPLLAALEWSRWRNPAQNFVNLGRLYQGTSFKVSPPGIKYDNPPGWAYVEDGSIFFPCFRCTRHELLDVMKVAACFVRTPSDGKSILHTKDDGQTRIVLLE